MKTHLLQAYQSKSSALSEHQVFRIVLSAAVQHNVPVAFWRKPNGTEKEGIVGFCNQLPYKQVDLEEMGSGFVLGAFESKERQAYVIPADLYFKSNNFEFSNFGNGRSTSSDLKTAFGQTLDQMLSDGIPESALQSEFHVSTDTPSHLSQSHFEQIVSQGIQGIKDGLFKKVVLSRTKEATLPANYDVVENFFTLCEAYPAAFVSMVSVPGLGTWVGASPETLISVDENQVFRTVALAGTQAKGNQTTAEARWAQKEIEEQALVGRYIINCFKKIRLREYDEQGPRTVAAAHLLHLCSTFAVDMQSANFPQLGTVMLELLHPTSAVCGMPKEETLAFILANEGYDRALYSGFIGPVNIEQRTDLFVNLRCMQALKGKAVLYAGAGITEDSEPINEWKETELKMETMLKHIQ
ncbi:chorismate-binding protein [Limibacter armeniacum]|uniref:chorismate-binding protein n=1 Tax=Limibacter armeniacum TaxID=466084 RepID=UPI002FE58256